MPGLICNIVVKADLGRWSPQGIEQRCLEYQYTKIGRQTYFGQWTPRELRIDAMNTATPWQINLLWLMDPPGESGIDVLNTATPNLADKPTLADATDIYWSRMAISHCY